MRLYQKGFTYPVTLSILLSMCLFLIMTAEILLIEKKVAIELAAIQQQDYYFLTALKKTEREFQSKGIITAGEYIFDKGTVTYTVSPATNGQHLVTFIVLLTEGTPIQAQSYYNINQKKMVKWFKNK
ncbi:hypothetical protein A8F94_04360 [Bacillus sp. FJAT-27225]|uniref:competence type IV pilus minor pilin ComGG n=1 Tax=Bacillus sp. FJAT-27225 TaxID=1743144 RepID=UPI00080C20EF|nr:competence type IV pilus minor pilin ComGG [Bacillus sp. FJAT-27225]OCA91099.1 hypothetical protein A8F94_04360 [Bacillus sp. FJAT-27225]